MWSWLKRRRELDNEIEGHLELAVRELVARGMTPEEARAHAVRNFGNLTLIHQEAREAAGWPAVERVVQDLRHGWRRLRSRPATALLAVAMLAVAIGMTSAMFTVVDALLLRPAPFRDPGTLALLQVVDKTGDGNRNLDLAQIKAWRGSPAFAAVHLILQDSVTFGTGEEAQGEAGALITPGLIDELGATPLLGRTFAEGEGRPGTEEIAILAEATWRARYHADPAIVGRRVEISGAPVLIVGVMPGSFAFPFADTRVWRPLDLDRPPAGADRAGYGYARLTPGMPRADVVRIATDTMRAADPAARDHTANLLPITASYIDPYSTATVKVVATSAGFVFLALCANVMNLMLARLAARRREFALCSALGASRGRLLGQALWEQALIGGAAALAGLAIGALLVDVARTFLPPTLIQSTLNPLDLDLRAVVATSGFSLLAMVVAGLLPAWIGTSHDASPRLQLASRGATAERKTRRTTAVLLIAEVALAVALSVAAGIQLRSLVSLLHEDRGFDAERLSTFQVTFPSATLADGRTRQAVADQMRESVQSLPGVEGSVVSFGVPPSSGSAIYYDDFVPDVTAAAPVELRVVTFEVTSDFFPLYGIRLVDGRPFEPGDGPDAVVISRSMASQLWPATSAIGRMFTFGTQTRRVIGVARDIRNPQSDPRSDGPEMYEQLMPSSTGSGTAITSGPGTSGASTAAAPRRSRLPGMITLTTRCSAACPPLETIRARIRSAGAGALVAAGKPLRDTYAVALERPRVGAALAIGFAAIALLAVGAGLFAVLTRVAQQRQREFGIRLALGATPADIRRLVHANGLAIAVVGIAVGIVLAWALGRVLASVQHQVRLDDPLTWTAVVFVVGTTAIAAAWRPARQAMRVDPLILLREE